MRILKQTALSLAMAATPLSAQTALNAAPIPGPYQIIIQPSVTGPAFNQNRYSPPVPYWMQVQRPQSKRDSGASTAPTVGRATQQPFIAGWNWSQVPQGRNTNQQGYGPTTSPGFFPGYAGGQQTQPPRSVPNNGQDYGSAYPAPNYNQNFGGQPWGQQGFMPMGTPWGNGWNNNGYGYQPGYAPGYAMQPRPYQ